MFNIQFKFQTTTCHRYGYGSHFFLTTEKNEEEVRKAMRLLQLEARCLDLEQGADKSQGRRTGSIASARGSGSRHVQGAVQDCRGGGGRGGGLAGTGTGADNGAGTVTGQAERLFVNFLSMHSSIGVNLPSQSWWPCAPCV